MIYEATLFFFPSVAQTVLIWNTILSWLHKATTKHVITGLCNKDLNTTRVIKPNQSVHLMRNFNYFWWNFFSRKVALCASVMLRRKLIRSCKYEFHNCKKNHNCFSIILARQSGHFSKYRYDSTGKDLILIILKVCHNF